MYKLTVRRTAALPPGVYNDGQGLWLRKRSKKSGHWFLRFSLGGRRHEMGLGRWPDVSIAAARDKAKEARDVVRDKRSPIEERRRKRARPFRMSLATAIQQCFNAKKASLKSSGKAGRWLSAVNNHVIPKIGHIAVEDVDQSIIVRTLSPIWNNKPETARKALSRINQTLLYASALGLDVDLNAVHKARSLLGAQKRTTAHIPALPYQQAPVFYRQLQGDHRPAAIALRFLMLTAKRVGEVRFAKTDDIADDVWIIPAERTKTNKDDVVPIVPEALKVINAARVDSRQALLFPSQSGRMLSDAAMANIMNNYGHTARPHGFRATFRTWEEDVADADYAVKETALGHKVHSETVAAYQRSSLLEKRRGLLEQWAEFLARDLSKSTSD